ncbi:MAG: AMP-dependent synthetase [Deltaproteobacteria bacterium]|nr:MAG: AMP-dependent synthetase [Deltaproteobacteria bacterium]TMQ23630.1 MAG: AMP-dependent synthetase [Deltaproteobacteria bacterium]
MRPLDRFLRARDLLVSLREDHEAAVREFRWPELTTFNWVSDYFDVYAAGNARAALVIVDDAGAVTTSLSFADLAERSRRVTRFLARLGVQRGDRVLVMLANVAPLWETLLGAARLGAVVIPATTQLTAADVADRLERGEVRCAVVESAATERFAAAVGLIRVAVGDPVAGWTGFADAYAEDGAAWLPAAPTAADDPLLLYFTSGTTARPKLVLHTHTSYPVGHLSTMYWLGVREGDRHLNISSPGWAKHAWSCFFAPWNAGATVVVHNYARFRPQATLELLARERIDTLCAPPTVWRMLVLEDLAAHAVRLREVISAGEPLNPEVIEAVRKAWKITVRDGYGQTETTALIGNCPGDDIVLGSMGRPLPGYRVTLIDAAGVERDDGEIAVGLSPRPTGLMAGYVGDPEKLSAATAGGYYRTGDEAVRDGAGRFTFVGRGDDVFKSSDYRISPFELESVLVEHPAVAEAAVVPSPDPVRTAVPKAFVALAPGHEPSRTLGLDILAFVRDRLAPYKRVRKIEFAALPKTISGKIRRVELRRLEADKQARGERGEHEVAWDDER